ILSELASRKVESLPQFNLDQNKSDITIEREPLRPTCLACGISSFDNVEQQRAHYTLDWHRFNVKRRSINIEAGKSDYIPVTEQEFEEFTGDVLSSISGSESPGSDSSSQNDDIATLVEEFENLNIHKKGTSVKGNQRKSAPILWFTGSNILADGVYLGVYRNTLYSKGDGLGNPINDIKRLQVTSNEQQRYWTMLMIGGGHFAGLVLDIVLNSKVANPKEVKSFYSHMLARRKQGGSQMNSDNAKGKAKSAGASIRRYNESALQDDIRLLLDQWKSMIDQSELVFMTEEALQDHEKKSESMQRSIKDKPPLDIREDKSIEATIKSTKPDPLASDAVLKLINLIKQGKLELMKNHISKHSLDILGLLPNTPVAENDISKTPTLLHLASSLGHNDIVKYLLIENSDPTILSTRNMTPYDLAKDKETRNIFRRHMADHPEQWDWSSAHLP
ncbi:13508_t:CDS:2, partial [Acaulospora colombiana]